MVDVIKHSFVPKHIKLTEQEVDELLKTYNITIKQLPKISGKDPAIKGIEVKKGDIFKMVRESETNKEACFYRVVSNE